LYVFFSGFFLKSIQISPAKEIEPHPTCAVLIQYFLLLSVGEVYASECTSTPTTRGM
jgi:hypothetical protein